MMFVDIIFAEVSPKGDGINLKVRRVDDGKTAILFLEGNSNYGDINLTFRDHHNPIVEMNKLCNIINGFKETEDGNLIPILDHKPIRIKIKDFL